MPEILARAKVNLCLHVGAQRRDGLHDIFSLAVFPRLGDTLSAEKAGDLSLAIDGDFSEALKGLDPASNLVMRAARLLRAETGYDGGAALRLTKVLPAASGVGGGTADAAAALVLLRTLWQVPVSDAALSAMAFRLGADGPLCLWPLLDDTTTSAVVTGAGEQVMAGPRMPPLWICLVNPLMAVSTAEVFRLFDSDPARTVADRLAFAPCYATHQSLGAVLERTRNDLAPSAMQLCPQIAVMLKQLRAQPGCMLARMSGSGATCFGLFTSAAAAAKAANSARGRGWWAMNAALEGGCASPDDATGGV